METVKTLIIDGMADIEAGLTKLALFAEKDVIKKACQKAAQLVVDEAKREAPKRTGKLEQAIRVRMGRAGKGSISALAAVGKRWFGGDQFYGAFQEFGWKTGKRGGKSKVTISKGKRKGKTRKIATGNNRRQIPGEHFLGNAFDEKAEEAKELMLQEMRDGIDRELAAGNRA